MGTSAHSALSICAVAALLAGCGGAGRIIAPEAIQPNVAATAAKAHGASTNDAYQVLYRFVGYPSDAAGPSVLTSLDGLFYGTSGQGGAHKSGTVFSIDASGNEKVIYNFRPWRFRKDGTNPFAPLIAVNGTLYGTTFLGGTAGSGTIFSVTPSGEEQVLHNFQGVGRSHGATTSSGDGAGPEARLTYSDGVLYGTTLSGGTPDSVCDYGCGTVFAYDLASHQESVLYSFRAGMDGESPVTPVVEENGRLYGTTSFGGGTGCGPSAPACGTVYWVDTSGHEGIIYRFKGGKDGAVPGGIVIRDGVIYGPTSEGGRSTCTNETRIIGCGTIFAITNYSNKRTLYNFQGQPDGAFPDNLIDAGGTFYGTTISGGAMNDGISGKGTLFSLSSSGVERVLYSFKGIKHKGDGAGPGGVINVRGTLYGTTYAGGDRDCYVYPYIAPCGTVFSYKL